MGGQGRNYSSRWRLLWERRKLERKGLSIIKIAYAGKSGRDWKNATTNVQIYIFNKERNL